MKLALIGALGNENENAIKCSCSCRSSPRRSASLRHRPCRIGPTRLAQEAESYRRIVDHLGQKMHRTKFILYAIVFFLVTPLAAQPIVEFDQLPKEVRNRAIEVRKSCKELDPEMKFTDMQGIDVAPQSPSLSTMISLEPSPFRESSTSQEPTAPIVDATW
jgi:hypothetical protein